MPNPYFIIAYVLVVFVLMALPSHFATKRHLECSGIVGICGAVAIGAPAFGWMLAPATLFLLPAYPLCLWIALKSNRRGAVHMVRLCPYCQEAVAKNALACPHCTRSITPVASQGETRQPMPLGLIECTLCHQQVQVLDNQPGKRLRCPHCDALIAA